MSEEIVNNTGNLGPYQLAAVIDNHVVDVLHTDEFMFNVFKNHAKVIDITDKVNNGTISVDNVYNGVYDEATDTLRPTKTYPSWIWNSTISGWVAPIAMPADGKDYIWSEEQSSWLEIDLNGTPSIDK